MVDRVDALAEACAFPDGDERHDGVRLARHLAGLIDDGCEDGPIHQTLKQTIDDLAARPNDPVGLVDVFRLRRVYAEATGRCEWLGLAVPLEPETDAVQKLCRRPHHHRSEAEGRPPERDLGSAR
jgi:hypothetical protein